MQFIVMQEPKAKYRAAMVCKVMVVEAKSKRGALSMSAREFETEAYFKAPQAFPLQLDTLYRF